MRIVLHLIFSNKVTNLVENIERYTFWNNGNVILYQQKEELLAEIRNFPIKITAKGFFTINRKCLAAVRIKMLKCLNNVQKQGIQNILGAVHR